MSQIVPGSVNFKFNILYNAVTNAAQAVKNAIHPLVLTKILEVGKEVIQSSQSWVE